MVEWILKNIFYDLTNSTENLCILDESKSEAVQELMVLYCLSHGWSSLKGWIKSWFILT